jgi:hypothetical protein
LTVFGRLALAVACIAIADPSAAICASLTDRPPPASLQKDVQCMVRTLKAMPKIDSVKSEVARYGGMSNAFVQYRDRSKAGQGATIRFVARGLAPPFDFQAAFSGLTAPGASPNTFGATRIASAWKAHCGVNAIFFFA